MTETILIIIGVVSLFLLLLLLFCRPAIDNASDTMENTNSKIGWNSFSKLYFLFILLMASSYDFMLVACGNKGVAYILLNKISVIVINAKIKNPLSESPGDLRSSGLSVVKVDVNFICSSL